MKNLILCAIIFALGKAYSQCEKIYVNKLLSGSPICKLAFIEKTERTQKTIKNDK